MHGSVPSAALNLRATASWRIFDGFFATPWSSFLAAALVLAVANLVVLYNAVAPGVVLGAAGDPLANALTQSSFVHESLRAGEFPLWNPYSQFGEPQFWHFHPLMLAIHALAPSGIMAYKIYVFLPSLLVGVGAWLLMGHFVRHAAFRLLGAVFVQYGAFSFTYLVNPTVLLAYAHVPFLLYLAEYLVRNSYSRRGYLGLTLGVALLTLSSYPQAVLYGLLATGIFYSTRLLVAPKGHPRLMPWFSFTLFALLGVGAGILPLLLLAIVPSQMDPNFRNMLLTPTWYLARSLDTRDLLSFLALNFYDAEEGRWAFSLFNNTLPWLTLGLVLYLRRPIRPRLLLVVVVLAVVAYFIAFGGNNPAYRWLLSHAPYFLKTDSPRRALLITSTVLPIISALGFWSFFRHAIGGKRDLSSVAIVVAMFVATVFLTERYGAANAPGKEWFYLAYAITAVLLATAAMGPPSPVAGRLVLGAVAVLIVASPLTVRASHIYYRSSEVAIPESRLQDNRALDFICNDGGMGRVLTRRTEQPQWHTQATLARLTPDLHLLYDCYSTKGYMTVLRHRGHLFDETALNQILSGDETLSRARLGGVRWVTSDRPIANAALIPLGEVSDGEITAYFYEVPDPLPRVFVPPQVTFIPGSSEADFIRSAPLFDPTKVALIDSDGTARADLALRNEQSGPGEAQIVEYGNQHVEISASMEKAGWLVLSDTYYPGWTATVDGEAADIYQANGFFRAVALPEGEHIVSFRYTPMNFQVGVGVMGASAIAALVLAWVLGRVPAFRRERHG